MPELTLQAAYAMGRNDASWGQLPDVGGMLRTLAGDYALSDHRAVGEAYRRGYERRAVTHGSQSGFRSAGG